MNQRSCRKCHHLNSMFKRYIFTELGSNRRRETSQWWGGDGGGVELGWGHILMTTNLEVRDKEEFGDTAIDLQEIPPVQQVHLAVTHINNHGQAIL